MLLHFPIWDFYLFSIVHKMKKNSCQPNTIFFHCFHYDYENSILFFGFNISHFQNSDFLCVSVGFRKTEKCTTEKKTKVSNTKICQEKPSKNYENYHFNAWFRTKLDGKSLLKKVKLQKLNFIFIFNLVFWLGNLILGFFSNVPLRNKGNLWINYYLSLD